MEQKSVSAGLSFERRGGGVPLVFIHAFPLNQSMWEPQLQFLGKHFQVITFDLPGFGDSPLRTSTSTMEQMAEAVLVLLDELRVSDKCVFTGLSMGGYVLLQILKKAPERVRALVFASTRSNADSPEGRVKRFKNIELVEKGGTAALAEVMVPSLLGKTTLGTQPKLVSHVTELIKNEKHAGVCAALRGMAERPDSTELLSTIKVPSLFISGSEDVVIPPTEMEKMAAATTKSDYRSIPSAGHLVNIEAPEAFNDQFSTFLKRRVL